MFKWIKRVTLILTLMLAIFSFVLSFHSLRELAELHNISYPSLFPLILEFGMIVFSMSVLYRSLSGQRTTIQWALVIVASIFAGIFNFIHADNNLVSQIIFVIPTLFLLLSFESLLSIVKYEVKMSEGMTKLHDIDLEIDQQLKRQTELTKQIDNLKLKYDKIKTTKKLPVTKRQKVQTRHDKIITLKDKGKTELEIADELNVNIRTIKRDLKQLNGKVSA